MCIRDRDFRFILHGMVNGIFHNRLKYQLDNQTVHQILVQVTGHLNGIPETDLLYLKIILKQLHFLSHGKDIFCLLYTSRCV